MVDWRIVAQSLREKVASLLLAQPTRFVTRSGVARLGKAHAVDQPPKF